MQKKIFKHLLLCAILLIAFVSCTNKKTCPICFGRGTMNTENGEATCPVCDGEKKSPKRHMMRFGKIYPI